MRTILSILILSILFSYRVTAEKSHEQQIRATLDTYHQAEIRGDLDGILNAYAEDFVDPQGATKPMLVEFFKALVDQGLLNDLKADMSAIRIVTDGDEATAGPVTYTSMLGTNTYSYQLRKDEDGSWRFIASQLIN